MKGTYGEAPDRILIVGDCKDAENLKLPQKSKIAYLTQTTLSLDDTNQIISILRRRFPHIQGPTKDDICYATQNRQNAVKVLAKSVDIVLVVGAENSSNTLRLVEVAKSNGTHAIRIQSYTELKKNWVKDFKKIGITAGASAPEEIVQGIINKLCEWNPLSIVKEIKITEENVNFALPVQLKNF